MLGDQRLIEKAQTYDEATRKGNAVIEKRRSRFNTAVLQ